MKHFTSLTSNGAKADAETKKSHIWVKFACCGNLIYIKDHEERLLLMVFFCPKHSVNGQDANYIIYRKSTIIRTTIPNDLPKGVLRYE